jgi:hypothetical protein
MNTPDPMAEPCRYCGAIDRPLLSPGTGPHACKASGQHCGRFWRWVSLLSPSERVAHRNVARLKAMAQKPPSQAQLEYLRQLGDKLGAPETMAEASERIDQLRTQQQQRSRTM